MEEARRLLARLERIEALDRRRAAPADLLDELQALLTEAEAWARAEHPVPNEAIDAVDRCRNLLCPPETTRSAPETTRSPSENAERNSGRTLLA
jgi:hypothetical protein